MRTFARPTAPGYLSGGSARGFDGRMRAFDAAGAAGFAFLQSQLEKLDTSLVEPLQSVTHPKNIKVNTGGGWPEFISTFAANYGTTGNRYYGLQANRNTEVPMIQADIQKALWNTYIWAAHMLVSYVDLKKMEFASRTGAPAPYSLQQLYEKSVESNWLKALDYVVYLGFNGDPGMVNNPNAPSTSLTVKAGTGTTWAKATPQEMLNDVNLLITTVLTNSGVDTERAMPNRLLVPLSDFSYLTNPFTLAGVGSFDSVKTYIERNCIAAIQGHKFEIDFLPNDWLAGQGAGPSDRCICYRKDEDCLYIDIPQPMVQTMTAPVIEGPGAWKTAFGGCIGQVIFKRTTTMCYGDGI